VAERALKKIVFREEQEKMNVWVALLNLEHKYGTRETVAATLKRAAEHNNPKHTYLHAVEMYERADEVDEAEELYKVRPPTGDGSVCIERILITILDPVPRGVAPALLFPPWPAMKDRWSCVCR
jgi:hypothetical protein